MDFSQTDSLLSARSFMSHIISASCFVIIKAHSNSHSINSSSSSSRVSHSNSFRCRKSGFSVCLKVPLPAYFENSERSSLKLWPCYWSLDAFLCSKCSQSGHVACSAVHCYSTDYCCFSVDCQFLLDSCSLDSFAIDQSFHGTSFCRAFDYLSESRLTQ